MVRRQHSDRVADVHSCLVARALQIFRRRTGRPARPRRITRRRTIRRASGIESRLHRLTARIGSTRDRRELHDLCIREREVARVREEKVRGCTNRTCGPAPRAFRGKTGTTATTTGAGRWLCGHRCYCRRTREQADGAKEGAHGVLPWVSENWWRWSVAGARANAILLFGEQIAVAFALRRREKTVELAPSVCHDTLHPRP